MTSVQKALAELSQRQKPTLTPGQTAADALRGLPLANKPRRGDSPTTAMKTPTDPAAQRAIEKDVSDSPPWETAPVRNDPQVVRQVLEHDEHADTRLALRDKDTGEFASIADARRDSSKIVTDYVEKPAPKKPAPKKTTTKKATSKKAASKKAPAKKAPAKKAAKKAKK